MSLSKKIPAAAFFIAFTVTAVTVPASAAESPKKPSNKNEPKSEAKNENKDGEKSAGKTEKDVSSLKGVFQESPTEEGGPLYVKSDTLQLDSKQRVFTYKGNVEVVRNDVTITGNVVEGHYDAQNKLQTIVAIGNVVITKGETMRSTANRAVYNVAAATIELTEGPELYREGNALAADKVTMFINEDRSEAEGNVRVKVIKPDEAGK